jgi:hypothetical protein
VRRDSAVSAWDNRSLHIGTTTSFCHSALGSAPPGAPSGTRQQTRLAGYGGQHEESTRAWLCDSPEGRQTPQAGVCRTFNGGRWLSCVKTIPIQWGNACTSEHTGEIFCSELGRSRQSLTMLAESGGVQGYGRSCRGRETPLRFLWTFLPVSNGIPWRLQGALVYKTTSPGTGPADGHINKGRWVVLFTP